MYGQSPASVEISQNPSKDVPNQSCPTRVCSVCAKRCDCTEKRRRRDFWSAFLEIRLPRRKRKRRGTTRTTGTTVAEFAVHVDLSPALIEKMGAPRRRQSRNRRFLIFPYHKADVAAIQARHQLKQPIIIYFRIEIQRSARNCDSGCRERARIVVKHETNCRILERVVTPSTLHVGCKFTQRFTFYLCYRYTKPMYTYRLILFVVARIYKIYTDREREREKLLNFNVFLHWNVFKTLIFSERSV